MAKKLSRVAKAILETAEDMHRIGVPDDATSQKITVRDLGVGPVQNAKPISGEQIRSMRERANLSQATFGRFFNLSPGYISQLERGIKQPKGPALVMLNVIRRKGFEAIL